jgi:hypothetical protein
MLSSQAYAFSMVRAVAIKPEVRRFLARIGQKGGEARARNRGRDELAATARQGAVARWMQERFGADSFEALGIPGWEIVDKGLKDLAAGRVGEMEALAVAEALPRLRFLGVAVPRMAESIADPREKLYLAVEAQHGEMAHERFSAILSRVDSLCDALSSSASGAKNKRARPRRDRVWCR